MKKLFTLLTAALLSMSLAAQEVADTKKYQCSNGWEIVKGGSLILGKPKSSSFDHITETPISKENKAHLSANYSDSVVKIKQIKRYEWPGGTKIYYAVIDTREGQFYLALEGAISSGELTVPNRYAKKSPLSRNMKAELDAARIRYEEMIDSIPLKSGSIFYDEIIQAPGMTKEKLFIQARQWLVESFMDSKAVLEVNDPANGLLTGKGTFKYGASAGMDSHAGYVTFIISIAAKDGKFRYQLYNFSAKGTKSEFDVWERDGIRRSIEEFSMDGVLRKYHSGTKKEINMAKQDLIKMIWLAEVINEGLKDVGAGESNDISDF